MKYRRLGKTGLEVSVVGVGTWQLGGEWGKTFAQAEVDAMLDKAAELGINLIDTAECYGDHLSEQLVGRAIKGNREKWIVATKFGHHFKERFERDDVYEPALVRAQLEASLRALQTDYVDLYQFHSGTDEMFQTPGLWDMLRDQVEAGVIRHLGISISSSYTGALQIDEASNVGAGALQVVYNRLQRGAEELAFDGAVQQDLGVLARVPLASGFLSGKYGTEAQFSDTDVRAVWHSDEKRRDYAEQVEQLRCEVPDGVSMAQWALAWCLQHPAVTCVIPGCKNVAQVESNARVAELPLVATTHPQAVSEAGK
jgi:aryl-alcohol dehydrogenase-like predicted oxidoreductase